MTLDKDRFCHGCSAVTGGTPPKIATEDEGWTKVSAKSMGRKAFISMYNADREYFEDWNLVEVGPNGIVSASLGKSVCVPPLAKAGTSVQLPRKSRSCSPRMQRSKKEKPSEPLNFVAAREDVLFSPSDPKEKSIRPSTGSAGVSNQATNLGTKPKARARKRKNKRSGTFKPKESVGDAVSKDLFTLQQKQGKDDQVTELAGKRVQRASYQLKLSSEQLRKALAAHKGTTQGAKSTRLGSN